MTPRTGGRHIGAGRKPSATSRTLSLPAVRLSPAEHAAVMAALEHHEPIAEFQREALADLCAKRKREAAREGRA